MTHGIGDRGGHGPFATLATSGMATGATHEQQGRDLHQTTRCEAETEWRRTALREEAGEGETEALRPLTPLEADPVTVPPSA